MKKTSALAASLAVATALSLQFGLSKAYAASHKKVDCAAVMTELQAGKKVAEVAKDMKISKSSVYTCRKKAKAAAMPSPGAMASPAEMASPAATPAAH
jgi:predicted transcriptional regulator